MEKQLNETIDAIASKYNPASIFLYGSRARTDAKSNSDYEVGVLYKRGSKIARRDIQALNPHKKIIVYPFEYESFLEHKIDTPFPEKIFLRELVEAGKTLFGEKVLENLATPDIQAIDLLQRVRFDTGIALAAMLSARHGDKLSSAAGFSKSCLFGVRCLVILKLKQFPTEYDDIWKHAKQLGLEDYHDLFDQAFAFRSGKEPKAESLYKNISLLVREVKEPILKVVEADPFLKIL